MNEAFDKALALNPAMKVYFNGTNVSAQNAIENYRGSLYANNFNSAVKLIPEAQQMEKGDLQTKKFEQALEKLSIAQQVSPERAETYRPMALTYMYWVIPPKQKARWKRCSVIRKEMKKTPTWPARFIA